MSFAIQTNLKIHQNQFQKQFQNCQAPFQSVFGQFSKPCQSRKRTQNCIQKKEITTHKRVDMDDLTLCHTKQFIIVGL